MLMADAFVGVDADGNAEAAFQIRQQLTLVVQHIKRRSRWRANIDVKARMTQQIIFDAANDMQRHRRIRADMASAAAMLAHLHRAFQHRCTNTLARHFQ